MRDSFSTPVIPDHHLIRRIGEGAYGEIWLARNVIGTCRAVKIIHRRTFSDDRPYEREFSGIKRFEPISRTHPALMDVLQVGRNDAEGYFYYVMEVADDLTSGQQFHPDTYTPSTLSRQLAARGALPFDECLQIGLSLADGLAHLHQHALIHRDIKPSNIIFVNGKAKLADIGLVAEVSTARTYVGTEGFIPPEGPGTVPADIYSLGKVLYEASTGKDRHSFPELPTLLGEFPERDQLVELNEIILKACASLPKERHASARELHSELQMLVAGKSVKRLRFLERQVLRVRRVAGVSAALALLAAGAIYLINDARQREQKVLAAAYTVSGTREMEVGNFHSALLFFTEALRLESDDEKAVEAHRIRIDSILRHSPALLQGWTETGTVKDLQFDQEGRRVLIASGRRAVLREVVSGNSLPLDCQVAKDIETVALSPDGQTIVVTADDGVWIGNQSAGMSRLRVGGSRKVYSARFSPDGARIVVARDDHRAYVIDAETSEELLVLEGHSGPVASAAFSPDGQRIVTASRDHSAQLWDAATGARIGSPMKHRNWLYDAAFSPDGQRVVTAGFDHIQVWESGTGNPLLQPIKLKNGARRARFSPDQRFIVSAGWDRRVRVWNAATGGLALPVLNHDRVVNDAVFAPDGRRLATADDAGGVKIWDLEIEHPRNLGKGVMSEDQSRYVTYDTHSWRLWDARTETPITVPVTLTHRIDAVVLNRDASWLAVLSGLTPAPNRATNVSIFDAKNGALKAALVVTQRFSVATLSDDGRRFAVATQRDLSIWNIGFGSTAPTVLSHPRIRTIAFSPDGTKIAVGSQKEVFVWDLLSSLERPLGKPLPHESLVVRVQFTRNGKRLLTASEDGDTHPCSAQIWDLQTGLIVGGPFRHEDGVLSVRFNEDETLLATGGQDDMAAVWRVSDGETLAGELEHGSDVWSVRLSADGAWLITCAEENTRVWETATGQPVTPFLAHDQPVNDAGIFPGNDRCWVQLRDRTLLVWTLGRARNSVEELIAIANAHGVGRSRFRARSFAQTNRAYAPDAKGLDKQIELRLSRFTGDLPAWHERQAGACELEGNWFGAHFHLTQLCRHRPEDATARARRDAAAGKCRPPRPERQ